MDVRYTLPPGPRSATKVVAVIGDTGFDWAAYKGPADMSDKLIAEYGTKVPEATANFLFPELSDLRLTYRV